MVRKKTIQRTIFKFFVWGLLVPMGAQAGLGIAWDSTLKALTEQYNDLASEGNELNRQLDSSVPTSLQAKIDYFLDQTRQHERALEKNKQLFEQYQDEHTRQDIDISRLTSEFDRENQEKTEKALVIQNLKKEIAAAERKCAELRASIVSERNEIATLSSSIEGAEQTFYQHIAQLQSQVSQLSTAQQELMLQKQRISEEIALNKARVTLYQTQANDLKELAVSEAQVDKEIATIQQKLTHIKEEHQQILAQKASVVHKIRDEEQKRSKLLAQRSQILTEKQQLEAKKAQLETQLQGLSVSTVTVSAPVTQHMRKSAPVTSVVAAPQAQPVTGVPVKKRRRRRGGGMR